MASHTPSPPTSPSSPSPVSEADITVINMDHDVNNVTNASKTLESAHKQQQSTVRPQTAIPASPSQSKLPRPRTLTPFASARASYSTGASSPFWSKMRRTRSSLAVDRPGSLLYPGSPRLFDLNKPLPSPPVAQIVDPNSPPKARRTLLDAVYDTPTKVQWPALRPETRLSAPAMGTSSYTRELGSGSMSRPNLRGTATSSDYDVFVKRQSWRSSISSSGVGSGPVLTISSDADTVIMGRKSTIPEIPAVPNALPMRSLPQRSTSSPFNATLKRNFSRPSPIRVESGLDGTQRVLISPIRSMKPTRRASSSSPLQTNSLKTGEFALVATPVDNGQPQDDVISLDAITTDSAAIRGQENSAQDESAAPTADHKAVAAKRPINVDTGIETATTGIATREKRISTITIDSPLRRGTPKGRQARHSQSFPALSSARFDQSRLKQTEKRLFRSNPALSVSQPDQAPATHPKAANKRETAIKVPKPKRSFRNLLKRGDKRKPEATAPSQGFMAGTRSSLAKALTSTRNLSKTYLPKRDHKTTTRPDTATQQDPDAVTPAPNRESKTDRPSNNNRQRPATAASMQVVEPEVFDPAIDKAAEAIRNIIRPLSTMASISDRLFRTEIAEALVSATTSYTSSKVSAEEAKKHARDAELHAGQAGLALKRLLVLCDGLLDAGVKDKIKEIIRQTEMRE